MRIHIVLVLMFVALCVAGNPGYAQHPDSHQEGHAEHSDMTPADLNHEAHKDRVLDPKMIELNRRYDAAWARWRSDYYGIDVTEGMVIADIGAGDGDFAMLVAREVGPKGQVFANEIDSKKLQTITGKIETSEVRNVVPILGIEDDPLFPLNQVDIAVMVEVYHHLTHKGEFLKSVRSRVKKGSRFVIIEADVNQPGGHSNGCYTDPDLIRSEMKSAGFMPGQIETKTIEGCDFFVLTSVAM